MHRSEHWALAVVSLSFATIACGGSEEGNGKTDAGDAASTGGAATGGAPGSGGAAAGGAPTTCDATAPDCGGGGECLCYQDGPITQACYCTASCQTDADCVAPGPGLRCGGCEPNLVCIPNDAPTECCQCRCAAPDTPVETPDGPRPISALRVGDWVMSVDAGQLRPVPIRRTRRVPLTGHFVVEAVLDNGTRLSISGSHPTADGRVFDQLSPGDLLGAARVVAVQTVPYQHAATYDILPDSDTGTYLAGGALIGSTLSLPCGQ